MAKELLGAWKQTLGPYEAPRTARSVWQVVHTIGLYLGTCALAYWSLSVSYWLTLILAVPAAGLTIRIFILFHDCCHRSLFRSRRANVIVGYVTGVLTFCSYEQWKKSHTMHHAGSGNLNRRGAGDIWTMTVSEYVAASPMRKLKYKLYRSPFVLFTVGPLYNFLIDYRFNNKDAGRKERIGTWLTNVLLAAVLTTLCLTLGWKSVILVQLPIFYLASAAGVWLFYVQHQFEHSYFERDENWSYVAAAMQGSSYYKLPKVLQWFTGNIGFHHIHHLNPRVPNYELERAHASDPRFAQATTLTLRSSLRSLVFRLWDEESRRFVGYRELKRRKVRPRVSRDKRSATSRSHH
ncbi:fatty acid desaturase [Paenibacillus thermoaerophilus]|uniref:Fatty acid desaturase n=1 Tax=Paenibacillus thermoaerophilus TaxID=1215385 RepID=A0ABW2V264_9BACL|nr:fatty acid desaturase [Paenibacillus thermoaerophilus]TMV14347.1 fatty acid desaturase [Paenibacillus thermoaerophilus]